MVALAMWPTRGRFREHQAPAEVVAALDTEPIVLPAWDPMGALAK